MRRRYRDIYKYIAKYEPHTKYLKKNIRYTARKTIDNPSLWILSECNFNGVPVKNGETFTLTEDAFRLNYIPSDEPNTSFVYKRVGGGFRAVKIIHDMVLHTKNGQIKMNNRDWFNLDTMEPIREDDFNTQYVILRNLYL